MNQYKITFATAFICLLVGLGLGFWLFNNDDGHNGGVGHEHAKEEASSGRTWTCSMHPQIRQPDAGDCPICGMDLIPAEEAGEGGLSADMVKMSEAARKLASIQTATVAMQHATKSLRLTGKVAVDQRRIRTQAPHIPGRIEKLLANYEGAYVHEGEPVAYLFSPQLLTAQRELLEAAKMKDMQPSLFRAAKQQLKNWKISEEQISRMLDEGQPQGTFPVLAEQSGYVTELFVQVGSYVTAAQPLYKVSDLSQLWVWFDVYERDLPWVKKGDEVSITFEALPNEEFQAQIAYISPTIDSDSRVAKVRANILNTVGKLKPNMLATAMLTAKLPDQEVLSIPKSAVLWTGKRSVVYVEESTDAGVGFMMRKVELGADLGDSYAIKSGIEAGEAIAVNGAFSIDAAAQLSGRPSMMNMPAEAKPSFPDPSKALRPAEASARDIAILSPLYQQYLRLKQSLSQDDFGQAKKAIQEIKVTFQAVGKHAFTNKEVWNSYQQGFEDCLPALINAKDLQGVRASFLTFSRGVIGLAKQFGGASEVLYLQYCPMANSNQGAYWLSADELIMNPYFGASMLKCGENRDAIQP